MDRVNHLLFACASQLVVSTTAGHHPGVTATSTVIAGLASWGPDVDQLSPWRVIDKVLPDEELGAGGPMRHRGITHWWAWPLLAALVAQAADLGDVGWVIWALIVGWTSHLIGDFLFGERPAGIPLWPWWGHIGLGLNSGGLLEHMVVPPATIAALWWACGAPGFP